MSTEANKAIVRRVTAALNVCLTVIIALILTLIPLTGLGTPKPLDIHVKQ